MIGILLCFWMGELKMIRTYKIVYDIKVNDTPNFEDMLLTIEVEQPIEDEENIFELELYAQQWLEGYMYTHYRFSYCDFSYDYEIERM